MEVYEWELKNGITRTKEFEKKGLATLWLTTCGSPQSLVFNALCEFSNR